MSATAPVVRFSTVEEHVRGENTSVCGHARWSVTSFFVWSRFSEVSGGLLREVGHVVHCLDSSFNSSWFKNDGVWKHDIAIVGHKLAADRTIKNKEVREMLAV